MNSPDPKPTSKFSFGKLREAATKAAASFAKLGRSIAGLDKRTQEMDADEFRKLAIPAVVKAQLPASYFTKKHTIGRVREFRRALARLTPEQRQLCRAKGWV